MNSTASRPGIGLLLSLVAALAAAPALAQDLDRGEKLYVLCAQCHGGDGGGDPMALAPAIAGLPQWVIEGQLVKFQSGARGTHFDDVGGMRMRPMSMWLTDPEDVTHVAAFVANMPRARPEPTLEGGDVESGKQKYAPCIACHGVNGEGNEALKGPPLAGTSDWYIQTSLQNFKAGVRGTNPEDPQAMLMRPMSLTLADDQAILDVIAYITTLPIPEPKSDSN